MRLSWVAYFAVLACACEVGSATDAGGGDAGRRVDAARPRDAGRDAGNPIDSGPRDAGSSQRMVALDTSGRLLFFDPATPGVIDDMVQVTGLLTDEFLHGITVRQADGALLGVGSTSRLYRINASTGSAAAAGVQAFAPPLNGTSFGLDVNPVVDRLRIVSDTEQNLRVFPDTGGVAATDSPLNPAGTVVAAAYTNNFAGATETTLYVIDHASDRLLTLGGVNGAPSPNGGMLLDVGVLGVDTEATVGFDIAGEDNIAYAALTVTGSSRLYLIDLETGQATMVGMIGSVTPIRAIAMLP